MRCGDLKSFRQVRAAAGLVLGLVAGLCFAGSLGVAKTIRVGDFSFSDALGGFELVSVTGRGTERDPFLIVEKILRLEPVTLIVHWHGDLVIEPKPGGGMPARPFLRIAVTKRVINATKKVWSGFHLELQVRKGKPSVYRDGLSFDQLRHFSGAPAWSDRFKTAWWRSEPFDRVRFNGGFADPGTTVNLHIKITDTTPEPVFYLRQQPELLAAWLSRHSPVRKVTARKRLHSRVGSVPSSEHGRRLHAIGSAAVRPGERR